MSTPRNPTKKAPPRIKNYRSQASMSSIFETIRESLATHKARRVMFDNDENGRMISILFEMEINGERFAFRLPVRFERLKKRVAESYRAIGKSISGEALDEQTYTTGWATIRDWILAQMALIESEAVDVDRPPMRRLSSDNSCLGT